MTRGRQSQEPLFDPVAAAQREVWTGAPGEDEAAARRCPAGRWVTTNNAIP